MVQIWNLEFPISPAVTASGLDLARPCSAARFVPIALAQDRQNEDSPPNVGILFIRGPEPVLFCQIVVAVCHQVRSDHEGRTDATGNRALTEEPIDGL